MTKQLTLQDYLGIARRRKWLLVIPPMVFAIIALATSFFLKPRYTSQTLVLVEGQKVSDTLVKPAVADGEGGVADANAGFPKFLGTLLGPFPGPACFFGDAVPVRSSKLPPVEVANRQNGCQPG